MRFASDFRNSYFLRLIISYSVITVLVTGLCGTFLYNQSKRIMIDEIRRDNQNRLANMREHTENSFLTHIESLFQHKVLSTINPSNPEDMNFFLYNGYETNNYRVVNLVNNLHTLVSSNPGMDNITLYFTQSNFVVDHDFFYSRPENATSYSLLESLPELPRKEWFLHDRLPGSSALSYIYSLPVHASGDEVKGYLILSVDPAYLNRMFSSIISNPNERVYLYDHEHRWLAGSSGATGEEAERIMTYLSADAAGDSELIKWEHSDTVVSILRGGDSKYGWNYAIVRPLHSFVLASQQLQNQIVSACILVLVIGFFISYLVSRGSYSPVRKMIDKLGLTGVSVRLPRRVNEFSMVDHKLAQLNNSIHELHVQLNNNSLLNVLNGQFIHFGIPRGFPVESSFIVANIRLGRDRGTYDGFKRRMKAASPPYKYEVIVKEVDLISLLFFIPAEEQAGCSDKLISFLRGFQEQAGNKLSFHGGVGGLALTVEDIQSAHEQASYAQQYCFLRGEHALVAYAELQGVTTTVLSLAYDSYENMLKAGDEKGVRAFLEQYAVLVRDGNCSIEIVELSLAQIKTSLSKIIILMNANKEIFSHSLLSAHFKQSTFEKTVELLIEQSVQVAHLLSRHIQNHTQTDVIYRLKHYIDTRLNEDISLEILSEQGGLSTQYVSKLFKDVLQISFSDYITNARLERSCALLTEQPHLTVTDISALVGYRNVQYFCKKFKQKYSITPNQYRNSFQFSRVEELKDS